MIHHTTREIRPATLAGCVTFYELLGFHPVDPPPGVAGRSIWLEARRGDQRSQIHLMLVEDADPISGHLAVICPDYDRTVERVTSAGYEVDARRAHWGAPRGFVRDPAGNLVELMAWPPGETEPAPT
jgi:catechol 2,3-dioxygenase-like lactoylglutathione lyase family enzyme